MSRPAAASDVYQAIADPTRRAILDLLGNSSTGGGEKPIGELARQFDMTLSAVSQHMRVLRTVGLVSVRQVGRERLYRLNAHPLKEVADWTATYQRFWDERLAALGKYLAEKNVTSEERQP
jgi:DNA-binding transcriptional ArsR family regulator